MRVGKGRASDVEEDTVKNGVNAILRNRKGAALVEFIMALVPMNFAFFSFTQFAQVSVADAVMHHATTVAARYAMVSYPSCIPKVGAGADSDIAAAARRAIGPFANKLSVQDVRADYRGGDPWGDFDVTATYDYQCTVPLGKLICGGGITRTITVKVPHSGARYDHACH